MIALRASANSLNIQYETTFFILVFSSSIWDFCSALAISTIDDFVNSNRSIMLYNMNVLKAEISI